MVDFVTYLFWVSLVSSDDSKNRNEIIVKHISDELSTIELTPA
jgi:hypothetical protein